MTQNKNATPGEIVRHYRRARGWSQEALAAAMHTSREAVSRLERGATSGRWGLFTRAMRALGASVSITITQGEQ